MLTAPETLCVSTPLSKQIHPSGGQSAVINSNISVFFPQSQHGRIKSWVRGSSGVWPAITYAPVIWLYWLWAACCATLPWLGNIKLIIAIDRQSICQCVKLGGWADGLFASFPLPSLRHLCSQRPAGLTLANCWEPCVHSSSYTSMGNAVYMLDIKLLSLFFSSSSFSWEKTGIQIQKRHGSS